MFRNTFFGAMIRCVISQIAVSKSIDVNLKRRRKKGGIRILVVVRLEEDMLTVYVYVGLAQVFTVENEPGGLSV